MKKIYNILFGTIPAAVFALIMIAACSDGKSNGSGSGSESGSGGSMARFTINGDYLYTVSNNSLSVISLVTPAKPLDIETIGIDSREDIETIFTMRNMLFIGSQSAMYIYDITRPEFPKKLSNKSHLKSCDPVVAYGNYAYVTLNSTLGAWCGNNTNVLRSYDITNPENPILLNENNQLNSPRGLAVDGIQNLVFVCDNGVKAFDVSDPADIKGQYTAAGLPEVKKIDAYDCIAMDGILLVIGADGLYQLGYNREKFTFISKIDLR